MSCMLQKQPVPTIYRLSMHASTHPHAHPAYHQQGTGNGAENGCNESSFEIVILITSLRNHYL